MRLVYSIVYNTLLKLRFLIELLIANYSLCICGDDGSSCIYIARVVDNGSILLVNKWSYEIKLTQYNLQSDSAADFGDVIGATATGPDVSFAYVSGRRFIAGKAALATASANSAASGASDAAACSAYDTTSLADGSTGG